MHRSDPSGSIAAARGTTAALEGSNKTTRSKHSNSAPDTPLSFAGQFPLQLRPISRLWANQYMKALSACSKRQEKDCWYNIRVTVEPSSASLDTVVEALLVALDLGWTQGEWMVKVESSEAMSNLINLTDVFHEGYFIGGLRNIPEIEFIILPVSNTPYGKDGSKAVDVPVVLSGIPFHTARLNLHRYIFQSMTAQNKTLGIERVIVKQQYMIGRITTTDIRCHMLVNPLFIHNWDLEKPMKTVLQGWDNKGKPRTEMWSVTMRYLDECVTCGGFYHFSGDGTTLIDCKVNSRRKIILKRRKSSDPKSGKTPGKQRKQFIPKDPYISLPEQTSSDNNARTPIGFIVTD
ncbi:hypothetical protein DFH28DRAFT_963492 [Melampsora americana]|nr:hypothetical protein DFH28DRAFT_963492 [Melampsora americana]